MTEEPFDEEKILHPPLEKKDAIIVSSTTDSYPDPRTAGLEYAKTATIWAVQMDRDFVVDTLEGRHEAHAGDYLAKGIAGELWPIKREIFEKTYVPVDRCVLCGTTSLEERVAHLQLHEMMQTNRTIAGFPALIQALTEEFEEQRRARNQTRGRSV